MFIDSKNHPKPLKGLKREKDIMIKANEKLE